MGSGLPSTYGTSLLVQEYRSTSKEPHTFWTTSPTHFVAMRHGDPLCKGWAMLFFPWFVWQSHHPPGRGPTFCFQSDRLREFSRNSLVTGLDTEVHVFHVKFQTCKESTKRADGQRLKLAYQPLPSPQCNTHHIRSWYHCQTAIRKFSLFLKPLIEVE